ncbi:MAG TPA: ROK family protein [Streptosporangiaceae bacterium]|jgi:predicted NBD/HSP70 family sugar kinase
MARRAGGTGPGEAAGGRPGGRDRAEVTGLPGQRGSRALLRDLNVSLLIELVRQAGPVSRADLARRSELSAPTVSGIVAELLRRGIFTEVAVAPSSGGRPPILLQLDPRAGYVVGIKLRGDGLTNVVCDLEANVVAAAEVPGAFVADPEAALTAIEHATRQMLREAKIARSKVLGAGIGLSGIIDSALGTCQFSHLLDWRDVPLAGPLARGLRLPVWVDNDVNTLAVAEKWSGEGAAARNFITLSVGRGVGVGIVVDRTLYRGALGAAGEFGHVIVEPGGPPCECGRSGCLEALVSDAALCRQLGEQLGRPVTRPELVTRAKAGDPVTAGLLAAAGARLGLAVANMTTLLNPELLIVCGEGTELGEPFFDPMVAAIREGTFGGLGRDLAIKIQRWGNEAWAVGAATLVLRELFSLPTPDERSRAIWHRLEARPAADRKQQRDLAL